MVVAFWKMKETEEEARVDDTVSVDPPEKYDPKAMLPVVLPREVTPVFWMEMREVEVVIAMPEEAFAFVKPPPEVEVEYLLPPASSRSLEEMMTFPEKDAAVPVTLPVKVVEARDTRPPDWVRDELRVVPPPTVRVLVTFRDPPMRKLFAWVMVVPEMERVEVPERADAVPQKGKSFRVTAELVVTVPDPPPPPEQVLVETRPDPVTERQPLDPAREVIERFVVVAWPLIVVAERDTVPPDWVRGPWMVKRPVPVLMGPFPVVWRERVVAPTSRVVDAKLVMALKELSPVMEVAERVREAWAIEAPVAAEIRMKVAEAANAKSFLVRTFGICTKEVRIRLGEGGTTPFRYYRGDMPFPQEVLWIKGKQLRSEPEPAQWSPFTFSRVIGPKKPVAGRPTNPWYSTRACKVRKPKV